MLVSTIMLTWKPCALRVAGIITHIEIKGMARIISISTAAPGWFAEQCSL